MSDQVHCRAKSGAKSSSTANQNNAVKKHFTAQRGFSATVQRKPNYPISQDRFPNIAFGNTAPLSIQTKLTVGRPGDKYEQEADRVADRIMRMPEPQFQQEFLYSTDTPNLQRSCTECEEEILHQPEEGVQRQPIEEEEEELQMKPEEGIQRQPIEEEEEELQMKQGEGHTPTVTPKIQNQIGSLRGGGQPLSPAARSYFEPRFGHDFSQVRIHTDKRAADSARDINARSYTIGRDVVFGSGRFAPDTTSGRRLLAHELTHVIHQTSGKGPGNNIAQRTIGDGHDLTSQRFSGDLLLEAAYDDERLIRNGRRGTAVRLIQESLLAQGYALPDFGADGIFGNETETAVRAFQVDAGAVKLDGIVGPETMGLLDMHDPAILATATVFSESPIQTFAGYDASVVPNWLVVPVSGRRQSQLTVTPANATPGITSADPAIASVRQIAGGVAVTGVAHGETEIRATQGAAVLGRLRISIKNRLDRSAAFHYVCDSAAAPHCSNGRPSANTMRSLLNRVWHRQANVRFTNGGSANIVAAGDLGPEVDGMTAGPEPEIDAVTANSLGANYNVFRVWHHHVDGTDTNDASNLGNETIVGDNPCGDGLGLPHEAGHFLGVNHPDGFIMTPCPGARTRRVNKTIIDTVNP